MFHVEELSLASVTSETKVEAQPPADSFIHSIRSLLSWHVGKRTRVFRRICRSSVDVEVVSLVFGSFPRFGGAGEWANVRADLPNNKLDGIRFWPVGWG